MGAHKDQLLIVFAKNVEAGPVKTRLAATIGAEAARRAYLWMSDRVKNAVAALPCDKEVHYHPRIPQKDLWTSPEITVRTQRGADVGQRMRNALQSGFDAGYAKICLIGTDIPQLHPAILHSAFTALESDPAVFGPATDGGYYLVGLSRPVPGLFEDVDWGTAAVLRQSTKWLDDAGIGYQTLEALTDIDRIEDLRKAGLWPIPT